MIQVSKGGRGRQLQCYRALPYPNPALVVRRRLLLDADGHLQSVVIARPSSRTCFQWALIYNQLASMLEYPESGGRVWDS